MDDDRRDATRSEVEGINGFAALEPVTRSPSSISAFSSADGQHRAKESGLVGRRLTQAWILGSMGPGGRRRSWIHSIYRIGDRSGRRIRVEARRAGAGSSKRREHACRISNVTAGYTVYLHFVSRLVGGWERTRLRRDVKNSHSTSEIDGEASAIG
jgi:hypothetical protein